MKLNERFVNSESNVVKGKGDGFSSWSWLGDLSLSGDSFTILLGLVLESIIFLNSFDESLSAVGDDNMLSSDVNSLFDVSTVDLLEESDTDSSWVDVEDLSGSSVVEMVRHTLVDSGIGHNSDEVTNLDMGQVGGHVDSSVASERSLELLSSL